MGTVVNEYQFGDMLLRYETDEEANVGLLMYPQDLPLPEKCEKRAEMDSLVQVKITGDMYRGAYAPGNSMRQGASTKNLKYKNQKVEENENEIVIHTYLADERGYEAEHMVTWKKGMPYVRVRTYFSNASQEVVTLEMLSSFSLQGITPYIEGDAHEDMMVHRLRSRWSEEGKLESRSMEELQLNPSWNWAGVRSERFGSIGSMPVNHYFPFVAVEDRTSQVFWGAQLASPSSWQMEVYREDDNIAISGGIADREFGHWMKQLKPGECIETPEAILSTAHTDNLDIFAARLTAAGKESRVKRPESEAKLPIIFNEYCTTWGCPSDENIAGILDAIRGKGFSYFVIDCGWYKADGIPWDISMGDYEVSKTLFPEGLEKTVERIRKEGMVPGIWFEIENVGPASDAYHEEAHLLKRDGALLTTTRRRFWDMSDPWVQKYLDERVIETLKKYGFGYLKVDYNDEIGIGFDGRESQGEALRINMLASYAYFEKIKREIPDIIIENCASGGHRLEPGYMQRTSMASFSDAHECREIPIVAANLHRAILPEQSQIWAVIREDDSLQRIAYSVINTFLGRMCISGDVTNLTPEQWDVIDRGMEFYREIAPIIKDGQSYLYDGGTGCMHHPQGWQAVVRVGENGKAYVTLHVFGGELPDKIELQLPKAAPKQIVKVYSDCEEMVELLEDKLIYKPRVKDKALAILLENL